MISQPFFHEGEVAVQKEAGVDTAAYEALIAKHLSHTLTRNDAAFISARTFGLAASLDKHGRPWLSPLFGATQTLFRPESESAITIRCDQSPADPLRSNIAGTGHLGVLFLDVENRQRAKSLGQATLGEDGVIHYTFHRYFRLCPKYIFRRSHQHQEADQGLFETDMPTRQTKLSVEDINQLNTSDTTFIGSFHPTHGADATHRGGPTGFVRAIDDKTLAIPDYLGNGMFNTVGNLRLDNRLAFLCVNFRSGRTLHITGTAEVCAPDASDELAQRLIKLKLDESLVTYAPCGHWQDLEAYPHAPNLVNPVTPYL